MNWKTKALVQRTLDLLPGPVKRVLYGGVQQTMGKLRNYHPKDKVKQGIRILEPFDRAKQSVAGMDAVEIGTGWAPTVPLLLWLNGLRTCHTYDIADLLIPRLIRAASSKLVEFCQHPERIGLKSGIPFERERLEALRSLNDRGAQGNEILSSCNIIPHAPADPSATPHPDNSVDLVFSNVVLQHLREDELRRVFAESFRILKPGGWMIHHIDTTDMFSHFDKSISSVDYLQYSEQDFAKYNTSFCYQNRLRAPQFRDLMTDSRFEMAGWDSRIDEVALRRLPSLRIHADFARFSPEELCSVGVRAVARKPWVASLILSAQLRIHAWSQECLSLGELVEQAHLCA